jgi:ABC-type oligopeptide transport system substrate-binding subunit
MTKDMTDASPPRFNYQWKNENTLLIEYLSQRHFIDILAGLVRGVGKFYKENLLVSKINDKTVEVKFGAMTGH